MRHFFTALFLSTLSLHAQETAGEAASHAPELSTPSLLDVTLGFDGRNSLERMRNLLATGAPVNEYDLRGNTPLLLLCSALEMDYRYTTDPHFARAVNEAITLLMQHGANVLHENANGCNAAFYMQSKPELLQMLNDAGLMPKELAVRIPYETAAFARYMRKRTAQAALTTHAACRQYLIRLYCAPAYERAEARLTEIISGEDTRKEVKDIAELLDFMRLADAEKATLYVHKLRYWEHGEHLLEEVPSRVLAALNQLRWELSSEDIRSALKKLEDMLPASPEEMIDCFAAQPMGILLEMLDRREGEAALPLITRYTKCNEADLASTAHILLLKRNGLPAPTPDALRERFSANGLEIPTALNEDQLRIYECSLVDTAMSRGEATGLTAELVLRVKKYYTDMKLTRHAEIIGQLLRGKKLTQDPYTILSAHHSYIEQPPPVPRMKMAQFILDNPTLFSAVNTEQQ